ncbi:tetratricopeptide repeat protein [Actinospica durhamensis]|uniref:Tetratricopeptide repeat protein n=1 Tax=Actinospica durhamensis TaxID=1508375 RepID=A0A941IR02_9ACTN|nr:BTAD domain-containing putative transcriptional regulator [Actinospica durhamensis]MBR7838275.1 tetratricopeptide repeat protein [Actinospica durhamensis]
MRYAVLGPVLVSGEEGPLEINGTLRRTLLAALLLSPNQVVSTDQLTELLWGDRPRVAAATSLYNQMMRLRKALGPHAGRIRAVPPGYVIDVESGELDTAVFARHRAAGAQAAQIGDWAGSAREYAAALELWRGEPLADVPALQSYPTIQQLGEERILALQGRIEADLHLARHGEVIGELRGLISRHPWREAFHAQLMLALYRVGRQPEALEVYRDLRRSVTAEFGVEPGESVRELHTKILRCDLGLALPSAQPAGGQSFSTAPAGLVALPIRKPARQLPADTRAFTGREAELHSLIGAARLGTAEESEESSPTVVISAINGMGGIGKTALAVRAAHRLAEQYPDGQLFIDLHGHSADLDPVTPQDALDFMLRSIGLEPKAIPQELQARSALYRSHLAGTRTLIVLDNARNPAQVKPLIPAEPGCLVIVTSRSPLTGLDDAEFLSLDALPRDEAVALLSQSAGPGRVDENDPAAPALAQACGRLPLAIRILGARLRHRPKLSPASLLAALRTEDNPLAQLKDDDRDITRVFASSLDVLPEHQQQLFARLGLIPGPDFDAYAAAALQDTDVADAERQLESLLDHSLLIQHELARYRLHDLLRAYARVRARGLDPQENEAARGRLLDFYLETATLANDLWLGNAADHDSSACHAAGLTNKADAKAWFGAERESLFVVFGDEGLDPNRRLKLSADLAAYLKTYGPWRRAIEIQAAAAEVARAIHDRTAEARALRALGNLCSNLGELSDAEAALERALAISRETGDRIGEVRALRVLAWAFTSADTDRAFSYAQQATEIARDMGNTGDEIQILSVLAITASQSGRFEDTVEICARILEISPAVGNDFAAGDGLLHLSHAQLALGRFDDVELTLIRALAALQGSINGTANVELELGRLHMRRGRYAEATEYLKRALQAFVTMGFAVGMGYTYGELGRIRLWQDDLDGAMTLLETALRLATDSGNLYVESFVRPNIAYVHIALGEFTEAEKELQQGLESSLRGGFMHCVAEARVGLCALVYARDGAGAALIHYREVIEVVRKYRHRVEEAAALLGLGRCELESGDRASGSAHVREAVELYTRMGSALDAARAQAYLC